MKQMFNYIFISIGFLSCFLLNSQSSLAQEVSVTPDTLVQKEIKDSLSADSVKMTDSLSIDSLKSDSLVTDSLSKKKRKRLFKEWEPAPYPYLSIGTNVGRYVYQVISKGPQEYQAFINFSWKRKFNLQVDAGWGKENIDYSHLKYNTTGFYISGQWQYNLLKAAHDFDKDRFYIAPFVSVHQGNISEASIFMNNHSGFSLEEVVASSSYLKAVLGVKLGVEVELLPNVLLSWQTQAGALLAPNSFESIKPNFIPGFGNGDRNLGFRFAFNVAYYFSK